MPTQETDLYYTFLTGLGAFTVLFLVSLFSIVRHQRRKQKWLRSLSMRDQLLLEKERERISADLHDDFGSVIASVSLGLDNISDRYPEDDMIPMIRRHLQLSLGKLREISHNLVPKILKREGFCAAMSVMAEEINLSGQIHMRFLGDCCDDGFDAAKSLLLFRVVQEIVTNAVKHSGASRIVLRMEMSPGILHLSVCDNGKGFRYEERLATSLGFGLQNIRSRLNALHATCTVESMIDKGTRYQFTIPISNLKTYHGNNRQDPRDRSG